MPPAAEKAVRAADWNNPAVADIILTEYAVAPTTMTFVVGQPVRLRIRNTGDKAHTFAAPGFFDAVAVRTLTTQPVERPLTPTGYAAAKMDDIAFHGVGQIIRLTPHEQELARTTRNPFDAPPAPARPIDFGDLLGDLGALGPDPFGLNAPAPANPFGDIAPRPPQSAGAPAPGAAAQATPAPANPFDVLGALGAAPAPPAPTPTPTPAPAQAAATPRAATEPGLPEERENELIADWGPGVLAGLNGITLAPGEAATLTLLPLRTGTFGMSMTRLAAFLGMTGTLRIVEPDAAPLPPEVQPPAADLALLGGETK
ncbi:MAG: hypothetical protein FJX64_09360 [Alphaproteobacteria bacterium]|nr:hypothetical protein [Alphaproteobacteria bacterium]